MFSLQLSRGLVVLIGLLIAAAQPIQAADMRSEEVISNQLNAITLNVIEYAVTDIPLDIGAPGASLGDLLTFVNPIYDPLETQQIGEDRGFCSLVDVGVSYYCTWTVFLDDQGSIGLQGPFFVDGRPSTFLITGGSGTFSKADGEMELSFRDDEAGFPKFNFQFRFTP